MRVSPKSKTQSPKSSPGSKVRRSRSRGSALVTSLALGLMMVGMGTSYLSVTTSSFRTAAARVREAAMLNLAEAGLAVEAQSLWHDFKRAQRFNNLDSDFSDANPLYPRAVRSGAFPGIGAYSAGVIGYSVVDSYNRYVTIRSVGWIDRDRDGVLDSGEPRRTVDQTITLELSRSGVFDYAYFVNNYGWMYGFDGEQLVCNGDMRANGDFEFRYGTPTINGSIYACANNKLIPAAQGLINVAPPQWSNSTYSSRINQWMRQVYNSTIHGTTGSPTFQQWRDLVYNAVGSIQDSRPFGAVLADSRGTRRFDGTSLDSRPTEELLLPDLNDLNYYLELSRNWRDPKQFYQDGTPNPNYNQPAYLEVWNPTRGLYERVSVNGTINGSIALIGYKNYPIKIHGPVTVTQDIVIRGYVQGQGTLYAGRNTHIVGDIIYKNPPDFRGTNLTTVDNNNEKKDLMALAARGSVMMGNTRRFSNPYPLAYMTPPFTKPRYDEDGNLIPAFNALERDETGRYRYQSVYGSADQREIERLSLNVDIDGNGSISNDEKGISRVDSILFTNFVGGGNLATDGLGFTLNGSIICKDESMVLWSLPMWFNYDARIRERSLSQTPLIDIDLPRTPALKRTVWQSRTGY